MFIAFSKYLNFNNPIYLDWAIVSQIEGNPVWGKAPWGKALWAWGKPLWGKPFWGKGCWNCPEVWPSKAARVIIGIHIFKSFFLRSDLLGPKSKIKLRGKWWLGWTQRGTKMAAEFWKLKLRVSFQLFKFSFGYQKISPADLLFSQKQQLHNLFWAFKNHSPL